MPTSTKSRPAAKAQPVTDVRIARVAWQSAGVGALAYAVVVDARATTWPLAIHGLSAVAERIAAVLS